MSNFSAASGNGDASGEIMLFGVRLVVDSMRKSVSLNNLSQYAQPNDPVLVNAIDDKDVGAGYASADEAVPAIVPRPRSPSSPSANASRERKRGIPWTEEEHKLFLLGLQKVGKGDWRGISRNFVKTRTPSQVASHAQKYFLRRSNLNRRRRRSSLFDITTESVCGATTSNNQQVNNRSNSSHSPLAQATSPSEIRNVQFSMAPMDEMKPVNFSLAMESKNWHTEDRNLVSPPSPIFHLCQSNIATTSMSSGCDLNLNKSMDISSPLSLSLSLSLSSPSDPSRQSPFQVVGSSFSNGDSMISVA